MKTQAVLDAEAALAAVEEAHADLYVRRHALALELSALETELAEALAPVTAALNAALDAQAEIRASTLAPWESDGGRGAVRKALAWGAKVAWLRPMFHARDMWPRARYEYADRWFWTLDSDGPRKVLDPRNAYGEGAPTLEDMKVAADRILSENGWLLLDAPEEGR